MHGSRYFLHDAAQTHVRLAQGHCIDVFDADGITSASTGRESDLEVVLAQLAEIVSASFGVSQSAEKSHGIRDRILNVDGLAIWHGGGQLHGFASMKAFPELRTCYLHGVSVRNESKGIGGSLHLARAVIALMPDAAYFAFTTQNPVMYCLMTKVARRTFPNPDRPTVPARFSDLGRQLIKGRRGTFDVETFVNRELYTQCLYPTLPRSRSHIANDWFDDSLDVKSGRTTDGFLFIGEL